MSHIPMPMNTAHQHAANAEDYLKDGLLIPAVQEHEKAAEAFQAAIERSHDESARRTLRLLYNDHCKAAKDLRRRIEKLKEEGKDPSAPQKPEPPRPAATRHNPHPHPTAPRSVPSPPPNRPMTDSQNTGDESFMLLAGQRSDPGDAFNQFWNIMQGMLDNLSQPVAFATAPLGNSDAPSAGSKTPPVHESAHSSDTDADEPIFSRLSRRIGMKRDPQRNPQPQPSTAIDDEEFDDSLFDDGDDLSESFLVIPSGNGPSPAALRRENLFLKAELNTLQKRLEAAEKVIQLRKEQDMQLRDSIVQATREAQRVIGVPRPGGLEFSNLNLNVPSMHLPGMASPREAQYAKRVKELEEELRTARAENEKQKAMIVKFRERWEKLKETAKRKKDAKAATEAARTSVREKIVEEPEAEEELNSGRLT